MSLPDLAKLDAVDFIQCIKTEYTYEAEAMSINYQNDSDWNVPEIVKAANGYIYNSLR